MPFPTPHEKRINKLRELVMKRMDDADDDDFPLVIEITKPYRSYDDVVAVIVGELRNADWQVNNTYRENRIDDGFPIRSYTFRLVIDEE